MPLRLYTAPTAFPLSLEETKLHLRVDGADDETLITALIAAATAHFDGVTGILGRSLMPQTWDLFLDAFPDGREIELPLPPLVSVTGLYYLDPVTGIEGAAWTATNYTVDTYSKPGRVVLKPTSEWPTPIYDGINAVRVRYVAGYASAALVPAPIKAAMLLTIGDLYENRETAVIGAVATEIPMSATVKALTEPYRISWA